MSERTHELTAELERAQRERDAAREFFWRCWDYARGMTREPDGGEIQEWGEELGLLKKTVATAPCGEGCMCDEYTGSDFPTDCYRPTFKRVVGREGGTA